MKLKELAEKLHDDFCTLPHEDWCGWYYEKDWTGLTHVDWLKKAEKVQVILDKYNLTYEQFIEIRKSI